MRHFRVWVYLCLALSGLALSGTSASARHWRHWAPHPACYPVASWVIVPPNVCIKYVCAGGGFHVRCLPAPH
jgi:hypothetical protein